MRNATRRPSHLAATFVVTALVALGAAACGSSSPSSNNSTPSQPAATTSSNSGGAAPTSAKSSSSSGIPQGPSAGDQDADNNGGPSDGDGNI